MRKTTLVLALVLTLFLSFPCLCAPALPGTSGSQAAEDALGPASCHHAAASEEPGDPVPPASSGDDCGHCRAACMVPLPPVAPATAVVGPAAAGVAVPSFVGGPESGARVEVLSATLRQHSPPLSPPSCSLRR